jgi:hypothetical protein
MVPLPAVRGHRRRPAAVERWDHRWVTDALLAERITCYRRRAAEYDAVEYPDVVVAGERIDLEADALAVCVARRAGGCRWQHCAALFHSPASWRRALASVLVRAAAGSAPTKLAFLASKARVHNPAAHAARTS